MPMNPVNIRRSKSALIKGFACDHPECDRNYYDKGNLRRHYKEKHGGLSYEKKNQLGHVNTKSDFNIEVFDSSSVEKASDNEQTYGMANTTGSRNCESSDIQNSPLKEQVDAEHTDRNETNNEGWLEQELNQIENPNAVSFSNIQNVPKMENSDDDYTERE